MVKTLKIHSIETFGVHDGPGIRLVVFVQGCPFRCLYCHNPDTQELETAKTQTKTIDEILALLEREKPYFGENGNRGGITVSGGEPTLQAKNMITLFRKAKERGFHTCLDSCGGIVNKDVEELYRFTDLLLLDVKHIDPLWHRRLVGQDNAKVLENAKIREKSGREMWLRYVLVPGWTDQPEYLTAWAKYFAHFKTVSRVEILPYHELGKHKYQELGREYLLANVKPPSQEQIAPAKEIFTKYLGNKVVVN
ncbi:pyruvate formate lyase-activating protein [Candidatus Woesebacteria bacterium]|jgi:pyruvate formate lyase activating enzyme|nr:pyruvate formate lyase-activating protein [Candidatus Woesebacteria bacterium]HNV45084.1 pyruvate formate-lyase-activating protein [Candidatus Woesebacteria bacterium]HOA12210.1 pyruvate formate-lyase-activating protein [Candidatus Woesebacteria bacterium]HOC07735.1 pyruvate formate-lyase-activating protein [Candidatus Woesebacteria bacterium]HOI05200.1 pyruvate formate-lyase-activating protein [Candidatus Woesebacteria bacterium]